MSDNNKYFATKCDKLMVNINHICSEIDRIRDIRLQELDIDWDEYKAHQEDTDFDTIITICEDILEKINQEGV